MASAQDEPCISEQERAELRAFASAFWRERGYVDLPIVETTSWSVGNRDGINPFIESLLVFDALYRDRIASARMAGLPQYAVTDLLDDDPAAFEAFRLHTVTGTLFTSLCDCADVAFKHAGITMCSDPDAWRFEFESAGITLDGFVWSVDLRTKTLPPEGWYGATVESEEEFPTSIIPEFVDDRLREALTDWTNCFGRFNHLGLPRLFESDDIGIIWLSDPPHPYFIAGFDCDDFADAFIWWFQRRFTDEELEGIEFHIYQVGCLPSMRGHAMVVIRVGPVYLVFDPQTGELRGPIEVPTDGSAWPDPETIVTDPIGGTPGARGYGWGGHCFHGFPKFYPPATRPWLYEPRPWFRDSRQRTRVDEYLEALRQLGQYNIPCLNGVTWREFAPPDFIR